MDREERTPTRPADTDSPVAAEVGREQVAFLDGVAAWLHSFIGDRGRLIESISADALNLTDAISSLAAGGKRMRAMLCYWGWRGAGGDRDATEIVVAGSALELFQTAALIHDDIIDSSDTRRGSPSVHRSFSNLHRHSRWALDADEFGAAAGILAGDMCLSFSEEAFAAVGPATGHGMRARETFNRMRTEVMAGQYLDILEEVAGPAKPADSAVERAQAIIRYKAAKYSTEHPLVIGGALAGADECLLRAYSDFALPLGEAFQLRDDVLGVFGNPASTGKPAGDDLREGKRTVLVGYALSHASAADRTFIDKNLGNPHLESTDIERFRHILIDSGALASTESLIDAHRDQAFTALGALDVDPTPRRALTDLATRAVTRQA